MRKLFLLIPALFIAMMMNAKVTYITNETADALRLALHYAEDGDEIVMAAGTYVESNSNFIAVTGKEVTVRAAVGAEVLIQPQVPITVAEGGKAEFIGLKIDASRLHDLQTWYEHLIYATDANANNRIILEGCEIYGFALNKSLIYCATDCALDVLTINNCYFHNIHKSCVFIANTTNPIDVAITNSTIADITTESGYSAGVIDVRATSGSLLVDHCTFYDVQAMNTDYAAVGKVGMTSGAVVSNCIFALSAPGASTNRTIRDKVAANNCLVYNYTTDSNYGMQGNVTKTNCMIADPQFTDAANGDFSFAPNNWVTMELAPACCAATDGTDLGDPRWHTAGTLPSTDFASPYQLTGDKAKLIGNIWYDDVNGYIYGDGGSNKVYGTAIWKIHAERACVVTVACNLNTGNTSGHKIRIEVLDAKGNKVSEFAEETSTLPGNLSIPAEGDFTIILHNDKEWSSAKIDNITLTYLGGAVVDIPSTLNINDAIHNGTRADGVITFADATTGYAQWNVALAADAYVNIATTIKNQYGHNITISVFEEDGVTPFGNVTEGGNTYSKDAEGLLINLGGMYLKAGNYVVKYSNATSGSDAKLVNVAITYVGGAVQNLPGTTDIDDAWFSANGTRADGKITYPESTLGWAKWNINVAGAGTYNVTVNIQNQYGHNYTVEFLKEGESTPISIDEGGTKYGHDATLYPVEVGAVVLEAGNYEMKVSNAIGDAALLSVTLAYAGGAAIDLSKTTPASLLANADAILSSDWSIEDGKIVHVESKALTGWAKWNVDCADEGNFNVTVNIASDNGHLVRVEVFEDENTPAIYTLDEAEATKYHTGEQAINLGNIALEDKEYVFKVSNTVPSSHVQIASIVITYVGGAVVNIPNAEIPLVDALRSSRAFIDGDGLHFTDADHLSTISGEWAKWNIHVAADGVYKFTANCNTYETSYSNLTIQVLQGGVEKRTYTPQYSYSGEKEINSPEWFLEEGDYELQLSNPANHSNGYLTALSASVASNVLIVDEMATDMQYIIDANGQSRKPLLKRSFKANMYSTILFPFNGVTDEELTSIFGAGYELLEMTSAELEGNTLNLNFAPVDLSQNTYGTPYLIKPTQDVVNPMFSSKTIYASTSHLIVEGTNADFIGSYIKGEVPAGENNLFLGPDDLLYFSQTATPIKGMRAYFQVKGVSNPSQAIKRARIVTKENNATAIELVNSEKQTLKTIQNGQLIIIRDGVQYNVMGIMIK